MTQTTEQSRFVSHEEIIADLQIHRATLNRWRKKKQFPQPIKTGRQLRWLRADYDRWVREQQQT